MQFDGRPRFADYEPTTPAEVLCRIRTLGHPGDVTVVAIDGRSGSGKTTLADVLARESVDVAVVHTDDIAWNQSFFDWAQLAVAGVLRPLRCSGVPVTYRPPAWAEHNRVGSIDVPATARVLLLEGVGSGRRELGPWLDGIVWVETAPHIALQRVIDRDADPIEFTNDWMAAENPFLEVDQPWVRAQMIVSGDTSGLHDGRLLLHHP